MKANNNSNDANRLANMNIIIIVAIVAVAITIILGVVISTKLTTLIGPPVSAANKTIIMHIHPVLKLTVDGKPVTLPTNIGIIPSLWRDHSLDKYGMRAMTMNMSSMAPLHTHNSNGTIHVESNTVRPYTLGQFLDIWGGVDTNGKTVKATVDGVPVSDYRNIILRDKEQIHLDVEK